MFNVNIRLVKFKFLIIISFLSVSLFSQKTVVFIDNISKQPIDFLVVYPNCNSSITFISDNLGKIFIDTMVCKCERFTIGHLNYKSVEFDTKFLLLSDTIKLEPVVVILSEIVISAQKNPTKYWIEVLKKSLKKYQKDSNISSATYHYFLQSSNSQNEVVEEIKANLKISYSNASGFSTAQDYVKGGMFWFHSKTPFLNLDTEKMLLGYSPFAKKESDDMNFMPLNSLKFSPKSCKIFDYTLWYI